MSSEFNNPIFFDPKGRRGAIFRYAIWSSSLAGAAILLCFLFSIIATPNLPELRVALDASKLRPATIFSGPLSSQIALDLSQRRNAIPA